MTDARKFNILVTLAAALIATALAWNLLRETVIAGVGEYLERRWHYERVIAPRGLDLHEGKYWKEKK